MLLKVWTIFIINQVPMFCPSVRRLALYGTEAHAIAVFMKLMRGWLWMGGRYSHFFMLFFVCIVLVLHS